jgi:hypothetical protein
MPLPDNPNKPSKDQEKRPYRKPELKQIFLRPEEAVLGGCKATGGTGPGRSNCNLSGSYCSVNLS